jgi:HD-GYP domain-containing protein (c-di-GMP phosphodiesterase class II)
LQILEISGHIHDIGMIGVPDSILNKIDQLTDEEAALMHQHVALGRTIIERLEFLNDVIPGAFAHHERWDGAGYPDGLAGDAIPLDGRILAVADAYDAMTSPRPYRQAMTDEQARAIIRTGAGSQWDPTVVQAFLAIIDQPIES